MGRRLSSGKKKWIVPTERDLAIFRFLSEQKFGAREQIARRFFPHAQAEVTRPDRVCARRLIELRQFGLLESRPVVMGGLPLWQASRLGLAQLANEGEAALPYIDNIDVRTYEHDRRVTDFRVGLEWLGAKDWLSERRLVQRGWTGHLPDAVFTLGSNRCALELELNLKRRDRYPEIFRSFQGRAEQVVLYLCGSELVRDSVAALAARSPDARRFYFGLWDDWLEQERASQFQSTHDRVSLAELV